MAIADKPGLRGRLNVSSGPRWESWIRETAFRMRISRSELVARAVKLWSQAEGIDLPPERSE